MAQNQTLLIFKKPRRARKPASPNREIPNFAGIQAMLVCIGGKHACGNRQSRRIELTRLRLIMMKICKGLSHLLDGGSPAPGRHCAGDAVAKHCDASRRSPSNRKL
jgi:hypothetical protein